MIPLRSAAPIVSAVLIAGLALSGCSTKEATKETKTSATSTSSSAATTSSMAPTTSATSAATSAAKPAGVKVAPADLPAVVSDRTHRGQSEGKPYSEYYAPDGTVRGKNPDETYTGTWKVVGEELCFTYPEAGMTPEAECYAVFNNGAAIEWLSEDGKIVETTYVPGNPDGL